MLALIRLRIRFRRTIAHVIIRSNAFIDWLKQKVQRGRHSRRSPLSNMVADAGDCLPKNGTVRLNGKVNGIHKHTNGHKTNGKAKKVTCAFILLQRYDLVERLG